MAKDEEIAFGLSAKQLGVIAVVLFVGAYMTNFSGFADQVDSYLEQSNTGAQVNQDQNQDVSQNTNDNQNVNQNPNQNQKPVYQVGQVNLYTKNKLDKASGVAVNEVEAFGVPSGRYSHSDLVSIASDPDRDPLDQDTNVSSAGQAQFTSGKLQTNTPYLYAVRGDSAVYDKLSVKTISTGIQEFSISPFTFSDPVYVYKVGSFGDIDADGASTADNTYDSGVNSAMNITTSSGSTYVTTDITVEEDDTGKALKEPVLTLRSTADSELETGDIESIYLSKKSGSDLGIPGTDLTNYIDSGQSVKLDGSLYDEETKTTLMGIQDSAVYTVKMTFDADQIQPTSDQLELVLDDLGKYKGRDSATGDTKASDMTLTFNWQS